MSPTIIAIINIVITLIEKLIEYYPQIANDFREIFSKQNPTPEDWNALRAKVLSKNYSDYVPESKIPKS